jgi:hypothetical protein
MRGSLWHVFLKGMIHPSSLKRLRVAGEGGFHLTRLAHDLVPRRASRVGWMDGRRSSVSPSRRQGYRRPHG